MAELNTFPFGQYRRISDLPYMDDLTSTIGDITDYINSPSESISLGITFTDKVLDLNQNLELSKYYLLKIKIKRKISEQVFNIKLQNVNTYSSENRTAQYVGRYIIPITTLTSDQYSIIQLVINPNSKDDYRYIVFEMERTIKDDYTTLPRVADISVESFGRFRNIIKDNKILTKIGIQAAPGMLFCINGEGIRVGPSGIYLINNGYEVKFLGVAVGEIPNEDTLNNKMSGKVYDYEYFTIDYRYK